MPQNPRSHENHYGGTLRHHPEHDAHIEENFTDDNQDYSANAAEYNDQEETRFSPGDAQAHDHHDRPEAKNEDRAFKASNYSEGGHGRKLTKPRPSENSDNKDYAMNKDFNQGAKQKYQDSEEKHVNESDLPEPE